MTAAAFNLTKWASNSKLVMDGIDPDKRATSLLVKCDSRGSLKTLGVSWDLIPDCFRFLAPTESVSSHDPMTKRSLLSLASRMFDPMGLISPFTVRAKVLFQELWRRGLEWDDPLDSDIEQEWSSWKSELLQLKDVTIPRWFGTSVTSKSIVELHGFGDASPRAYGAAVYIRVIDNVGQVSSKLVMSKSRVAPIKEVSLPRLELLAAVVNARLLKFVVDTLQIKMHRVVCWTDSMVTLPWIRRQSSCWRPFVANRVSQIQSTWDPKLIRVIAYVLKAVKLFKAKSKSEVTELSAEEMQQAELKCCMWVQQDAYKEDYELLKAAQALPKSSRPLKLDPYYDKTNQIIRVGGRLQFADIPEETKHQIILPHGHTEVARMILDVHKQMLHAGPETVLSTLRQRIWITPVRREVKRIVRKCVICQRQCVGPCGQKMGPLPEERVTPSLPFSDIGTDFAGPLCVKVRTIVKKSYVCLFTRASSRMVHLELTNSLTTDEFLQAFSRMTSRRGLCHTVWADNAKAFKAASNEIQRLYSKRETQSQSMGDTLDQNRIESELASKGIKWKFITERSPWRGGWWERFCRAVKEPLRKVLGKALLTFTELNTLLVKIEVVINSRPLTAVSDDHRDPSPITPAHLAIGRPLNQLPDVSQENPEESSKRIMERYLYLQRLFNHYWKRWKQEYLYHLTVRNKWRKEEPPLQVGDIVLVSEDNVSRGKWPLARVTEVLPGRDGLVRTATVRTEKSFLNSLVQRLHRLEIASATPQLIPDTLLCMVGRSWRRTVLIVKVFLSLSLSVMLPSPKEDKVGRILQPVALARVDLVRSRTDLTCNGTPVGTPR